jgi:hypothetical protein
MKKRIATLFLSTILPTALFANENGLPSDLLDRVNSAARVPPAALGTAMSGADQTFAVTSARETASRAAFESFTSSPGGMVEAAGALEGVPQAAFGMPTTSPDQMVGAMGALGGVPQAAVATPASNQGRMVGAWGVVPQAAVAAPASNPDQMVGAPGDTPQAALETPASNLGGMMVGAAGALEGTFWATHATELMLNNASNAERESTNVPVGLRSFSATGTGDSR